MVNYTPKTAKDSKKGPEKSQETKVLVKDLTSRAFLLLTEDDPILEAQQKLLKQKLPGSPVVDAQGAPVGFLSEKDCLVRVMKMKYHNDVSERVGDFMSPECVTILKEEHIMKAVEMFSDKAFNILPVVSSKNKVVGVLTRQSVFRYVVGLKQQNW